MTRLLLADQHDDVMRALASFLREVPELEVVGTASEAVSLIHQAEATGAELLLVEFGLPGCVPAELFATLHRLAPRPRIVAMSAQPEDGRAALRAGADAFLSKAEDGDWALDSLRRAVSRKAEANDPG